MLDAKLIETLEIGLRQTRNAQNRLISRLQEAENEVNLLRQEINDLESSAAQTELTIDSLLVEMRSSNRQANRVMRIDDEY